MTDEREPDIGEICMSIDIDNCAEHGVGTEWRRKWDARHTDGQE